MYIKKTKLFSVILLATLIVSLFCNMGFSGSSNLTWKLIRPFNKGNVNPIIMDSEGTLYCIASGIWKSTDNGDTWVSALGNLGTSVINVIAVDTKRNGVLFAGTDKGLYKSVNGGSTWTDSGSGLPRNTIQTIAIDPITPTTVYIGTSNGLFKSIDDGSSWVSKNSGIQITSWAKGQLNICSIAINPVNPKIVYANTWRSYIHVSTNGGETWTAVLNVWQGKIKISRSNPNIIYTTHDPGWDDTFKGSAIIRSIDSGQTWQSVKSPLEANVGISEIEIDPRDSDIIYASTEEGLYKSVNAGSAWSKILKLNNQAYVSCSRVDPDNSSVIYAATSQGIYKTLDGGNSWDEKNQGMVCSKVYSISVNNTNPSHIYSAVSNEGVIKSTDGGLTWDNIGFKGTGINSITSNPTNPDILLASGWDETVKKGIFKSTDGGVTWSGKYNNSACNLAYSPLNPSKVFGCIGDWIGGIIMSNDGGDTWYNPEFNYIYPSEFAFHPTDPNKIYVGYGRYTGSPIDRGGIAYTTNGGLSWSLVEFVNFKINTLVIDKNNPSILYAGSSDGGTGYAGVWKSTDGGMYWVKSNTGLTNTSVNKLVIDEISGNVYAATASGVFFSKDNATTWNLITPAAAYPNQNTTALSISPDASHIFAGTSGGLYEYSLGTQFTVTPEITSTAKVATPTVATPTSPSTATSTPAPISNSTYNPAPAVSNSVQNSAPAVYIPTSTFSFASTVTPAFSPTPKVEIPNTPYPAAPQPSPSITNVEDIPEWAKESIGILLSKGIISGDQNGKINPTQPFLRVYLPKILVNCMNVKLSSDKNIYFKDKADIPGWAVPYLNSACDYALISGYPDLTFKPNKTLTRAEAVTVIIRLLALKGLDIKSLTTNHEDSKIDSKGLSYFSDCKSHWASENLQIALEMKYIDGYPDKTLRPDGIITRAEFFTMLARTYKD